MKRISKGAQQRAEQDWRTARVGWPAWKPWPIANDVCRLSLLPHQGQREKARRVRQMAAGQLSPLPA